MPWAMALLFPFFIRIRKSFGLSDFDNGLLFALFSLCQFVSTPIIGRLSDKYGRRPLLIVSIAGTAVSFFMAAFAPSAIFLFLARALDGITAGNIPVASAVISDTTAPKDRARGFGILGASFGFGFIFGPAISAFTIGFGQSVPFMIAGVISIIATLCTILFLPETNTHMGEVSHGKLFDFAHLIGALKDKMVGMTLLISLIYSTAFSMFIYAFQPYSVKVLHLTPTQISIIFSCLGIVGLLSQIFLLHRLTQWFGVKRTFSSAIFLVMCVFTLLFFISSYVPFLIALTAMGLFNTPIGSLIQTILSQETDANSQGTIQGLNTSYVSIGQIIGPILGGAFATQAIGLPFLAAAACMCMCFFASFRILMPGYHKESAF
ncbi:MAG: Tetracycline resistance protein, class B [Microgenomates bacterium OLB23]|nr:MAG: Tetracycline resistance protein, class B [Microgenomates bacterium OLB23]